MATEKKAVKKDTKDVIKKSVTTSKAKSTAKKSLVVDPYEEIKKTEKKRVKSSADEFIKSEFVSEEYKQKYSDLVTQIDTMTLRLKELYGIESEGIELADMVNAHNTLQSELEEEAKELEESRKKEQDETVENYKKEISDLKKEFEETKKSLNAEEAVFKKELKVLREREESEYTYNLNRSRSIENDKWSDEKTAREKELSDREEDLKERVRLVSERELKMNELEEKVSEIPELVNKAIEEGRAAGKSEAEKSHVFETRSIQKQADFDKKLLEEKVKSQEDIIQDFKEKVKELESKLDSAYSRNQELATTVAQNSGNIKVVSTNESTK